MYMYIYIYIIYVYIHIYICVYMYVLVYAYIYIYVYTYIYISRLASLVSKLGSFDVKLGGSSSGAGTFAVRRIHMNHTLCIPSDL